MKNINIALFIMWIVIIALFIIGIIISQKQISLGNIELTKKTFNDINNLAEDNNWNQVMIVDMETGKGANLYPL